MSAVFDFVSKDEPNFFKDGVMLSCDRANFKADFIVGMFMDCPEVLPPTTASVSTPTPNPHSSSCHSFDVGSDPPDHFQIHPLFASNDWLPSS